MKTITLNLKTNFMKMKSNFKFLTVIALFASVFYSCESDDDGTSYAAPVISDVELGIGNSHVAYLGSDLHIELDVVAEGTIDIIEVEIHNEDNPDGWEGEYLYDEFSGLLNTTFHKHIDIPSDIETGDYHFHFTVTDMQGNQTSVEEELEIQELIDDESPVISVTASPEANASFTTGETISISGTITDNFALSGMLVALVRTEDNFTNAEVTGSNTSVIVMMHTHDFTDPDEVDFTASIEVGATMDNNMTPAAIAGDNAWQTGSYYILVKTSDANGNGMVSTQYPININI
jgi:hypothetical protein